MQNQAHVLLVQPEVVTVSHSAKQMHHLFGSTRF